MNTTHTALGWRFLLIWIFATFFGILASRFIPFLVSAYFEMHPLMFDDPGMHMIEIAVGLIALTSGVGLGIVVGFAQWFIVRRSVAIRVIAWLGVTTLAFLITILVELALKFDNNMIWEVILGIFITGTTLGVLQWIVLYKKVDRAFLWIGISLVSWMMAGLAVGILTKAIEATVVRILLSNTEFFGTLFSTFGLWWFLNYSTPHPQAEVPEASMAKP
jgi:hypothetical protein